MKTEMITIDEGAVRRLYQSLTKTLIERNLSITTMESLTSGMIASLITDTEGASAILKEAFVTYSNEAKIRRGVKAEIIERRGVYSKQTAGAMAEAAASAVRADIGIGITGSAGNPDPANADSVCGRIFFAITGLGKTRIYQRDLPWDIDRRDFKLLSAAEVGGELRKILDEQKKSYAAADLRRDSE